MTTAVDTSWDIPAPSGPASVEMPKTTVWPLVLALGITLLGAGLATNLVLSIVGGILFLIALRGWISDLLPGRGHAHEPLVEPTLRAKAVIGKPGMVEHLRPGMVGHRFRLPEKVHPISSGVKGGIVGGLVMPIPALAYGIISGHGIWFPVNLLAGMVIPGSEATSLSQLQQFHLGTLILAIIIHAVLSIAFGLFFGVVSPTLPPIPGGPVIAGGILMPFLWSGICHSFIGIINPLMQEHVNWPWFVVSQIVYGLAMSIVVVNSEKVPVSQGRIPPSSSAGSPDAGQARGQH